MDWIQVYLQAVKHNIMIQIGLNLSMHHSSNALQILGLLLLYWLYLDLSRIAWTLGQIIRSLHCAYSVFLSIYSGHSHGSNFTFFTIIYGLKTNPEFVTKFASLGQNTSFCSKFSLYNAANAPSMGLGCTFQWKVQILQQRRLWTNRGS